MVNSIHQFAQKGAENLTRVFEEYTDDLTKIAEMVKGVTDEVVRLGASIIAEEWESHDGLLRKRKGLRPGWQIVRRDGVTRTTSLGDLADMPVYTIPYPQVKKIAALKNHIWGL